MLPPPLAADYPTFLTHEPTQQDKSIDWAARGLGGKGYKNYAKGLRLLLVVRPESSCGQRRVS